MTFIGNKIIGFDEPLEFQVDLTKFTEEFLFIDGIQQFEQVENVDASGNTFFTNGDPITTPTSNIGKNIKLEFGDIDGIIDWGDEVTPLTTVTGNTDTRLSHTYLDNATNIYNIKIYGNIYGKFMGMDKIKLIHVISWGRFNLNDSYTFANCENLETLPLDAPKITTTSLVATFINTFKFNSDISSWDLVGVTNISLMFRDAWAFNQPLNNWDTSTITDMNQVFQCRQRGYSNFNQPLDQWDTSNVTTMSSMFAYATVFNQNLSTWDTGNVISLGNMFVWAQQFNNGETTDLAQNPLPWNTSKNTSMGLMFYGTKFNQDISTWDVSKVTNFDRFAGYSRFGGDVSKWDTSSGISMYGMFFSCPANYPLNTKTVPADFEGRPEYTAWDVSNVTDMFNMFRRSPYNHPVDQWNTSGVTNMGGMFEDAYNFNQDISSWNISNVTNMKSMFVSADSFNNGGAPLTEFTPSGITDMSSMFNNAKSFNQDISHWDVSMVENMNSMFRVATSFNQPLNDWNVSGVTDMGQMFQGAESFNQPLSGWDFSNVTNLDYFIDDLYINYYNNFFTNYSTENYTTLLANLNSTIGIANDLMINVGGSLASGGTSNPDRVNLISNKNWLVEDGDSPSFNVTISSDIVDLLNVEIDVDTPISLSGSVSGSQGAITHTWTTELKPTGATPIIGNSTSLITTISDFNKVGRYILYLTVTEDLYGRERVVDIDFTITDTIAPVGQSTLTLNYNPSVSGSTPSIGLSWTSLTDPSGVTYKLEKNTNSAGWVLLTNTTSLSYNDTSIIIGSTTLYEYRVSAVDGGLNETTTSAVESIIL